jgi:hypothetical protein
MVFCQHDITSSIFVDIYRAASPLKHTQTKRICRAWEPSFARGFAWVNLDRVRDNLDPAPGSRNRGSDLDADFELNFFYPPSAGEGRS